jgi:hypothetical protein
MFPYQLVCEGKADEVFFDRLLTAAGKQVDVSCPKREEGGMGITGIRKRLIGLNAQKDKISLLVVALDCDDDPAQAFNNGQTELQRANEAIGNLTYTVPVQANTLTNGTPRTAILMVPAIGVRGCLDSLLLPSFEQAYPGRPVPLDCVDNFCTCMQNPARGYARDARLRLRALIAATQNNPGYSLANLLEEGHCPIDLNHVSFNPIKAALNNLFP